MATLPLNSSRTVAYVHGGWPSELHFAWRVAWPSELHFAWRVAVDAVAAISTETAMLLAGDKDCHRR